MSPRCVLLESFPTKTWPKSPRFASGSTLKIAVSAVAPTVVICGGLVVVVVDAPGSVVVVTVLVVAGHPPAGARQKSFRTSTSRRGRVGDFAIVLMRRPGFRRCVTGE